MYNQELKERFISNQNDKTAELYTGLFQKLFPIETEYEKDISDFNGDEVHKSLLRLSFIVEENGVIKTEDAFMIDLIKKYCDFVINEKIENRRYFQYEVNTQQRKNS